MIADGRLSPGDRLPPEHALAQSLGVSRGSLREAVRALSQLNVLDVRRGDGTYVRSLEPSDLLSGLVLAIELVQPHGLDEVLEVRRLLLPPAAALAAQRVTPEQLEALRCVLAELDVATESDHVADLHRQFQALVAEATGNEWLISILRALQLAGESVRRAWLDSDPVDARRRRSPTSGSPSAPSNGATPRWPDRSPRSRSRSAAAGSSRSAPADSTTPKRASSTSRLPRVGDANLASLLGARPRYVVRRAADQ